MNSADAAAIFDTQRKEIARKLGYGSWQQFEALSSCDTMDAVAVTMIVLEKSLEIPVEQGKQEADD